MVVYHEIEDSSGHLSATSRDRCRFCAACGVSGLCLQRSASLFQLLSLQPTLFFKELPMPAYVPAVTSRDIFCIIMSCGAHRATTEAATESKRGVKGSKQLIQFSRVLASVEVSPAASPASTSSGDCEESGLRTRVMEQN